MEGRGFVAVQGKKQTEIKGVENQPSHSLWHAIQHWAPPVLVAVALGLMAWMLASQWQELASFQWRISSGWLLLSALLMLLSWALEIQIWRMLLHLLGATIPWFAAMRIWFLSAVMRYIPGNIWQPLSMTLYAQKHAIRPETTLTSFLLYQVVLLLASMPLAGFYFLFSGNWGVLTEWVGDATIWLVAGILLPVAAFLLVPAWLVRILNWLLVKVGRETIDAHVSRATLFLLLIACTVNWLLWGATFAALAFGVAALADGQIQTIGVHLVLVYPIAYTIGFLSLITPSGIGVREGTLFLLLSPLMAGSVVTVISLAMRVWTIAGELIMALVSVAIPDPIARAYDARSVAPPVTPGDKVEA